jgi:hypothetical protein
MIHIVRSEPNCLAAYFSDKYNNSSKAIRIYLNSVGSSGAVGFPYLWAGARQLFPQFRKQLGDIEFEFIINKHKVAASLLLDLVIPSLTMDEMDQRANICANIESNLSHNFFVQEPLYLKVRDLIAELIEESGSEILIPSITNIDAPTLTIFFEIFKIPKNRYDLNIHIGLDNAYSLTLDRGNHNTKEIEFDKEGLLWRYSDFGIKNVIFSFIALGGKIENIENQGGTLPTINFTLDRLDGGMEGMIFSMCENGKKLDFRDAANATLVILRAYESFDFNISLSLGRLVLTHPFPFTKEQLALLHSIVALSAHNRQFSSSLGNKLTNDFIENHLKIALENEENIARKAFLEYRMAVLKARRQRDLSAGLHWVDLIVESANRKELVDDKRFYLEAWALNIRAYINMRNKDFQKAKDDIYRANEAILNLYKKRPNSRDIAFTTSVMADNAGALLEVMGDLYSVKGWLKKSYMASGFHITNQRFGARIWSEIHIKMLRIDLALNDTLVGLRAAKSDVNPFYEDLYLCHLGDFNSRLGDSRNAHLYWLDALKLHGQYQDEERYLNVAIIAAYCATLGGMLDEAEKLYDKILKISDQLPQQAKANLAGHRAILAAYKGDFKNAELLINEAISLSSEQGELFGMAYTAGLIGKACFILKLKDECRKAYIQAISLIQEENTQLNSTIAAIKTNVILEYLNMGYSENENKELLRTALNCMPQALVRSYESWWNLPLAMSFLEKYYRTEGDIVTNENLDKILLAASQRQDCLKILNRFLNMNALNLNNRLKDIKQATSGTMKEAIKFERAA